MHRSRRVLPVLTVGSVAIAYALIRHRRRISQILQTFRQLTKLIRAIQLDNVINNENALDRVLQTAATPDGQSVIRALSSGAVSALSVPPPQRPGGQNGNQIVQVLQALASPQGRQVVSTIVSTGVREVMQGVSSVTASQNPQLSISQLAGSEPIRKLILDVVQTITVSAVPHFVRPVSPPSSAQQQQYQPQQRQNQQHQSQSQSQSQESSAGRTQSKRVSVSSVSTPTSYSVSSSGQSHAPAKAIADRFVSRTRTASFWERLAIIAIRDRALVQDIVRVFVTHTVRTYLITQAELRGDSVAPHLTSQPQPQKSQVSTTPSSSSNTAITTSGARDPSARASASVTSTPVVVKPQFQPVWKLLARSVAVDLKRLVYSIGSRQASSGWTVF